MFYLRRIVYLLKVLLGIDLWGRNTINLKQKSILIKLLLYPFWYVLQVSCAILNLLLLGELLFLLVWITHKCKRKLNSEELKILSVQFPGIKWRNITVIEKSWVAKLGAKYAKSTKMGVCVTYSLHFSCELDSEKDKIWLLHEAAHYIQYKQRGIIYIFEALIAQQFTGYNYKLPNWKQYSLKAFNPEQQAEILSKEPIQDKIRL